MPQTTSKRSGALLASRRSEQQGSRQQAPAKEQMGFGAGAQPGRGRGGKRGSGRKPALSKADWGPLGKHPDLDSIIARQRLQLPLSGRISVLQVNQAWKSCASEHHPDRGGEHDTMQLVNGARDLLLSRDLS